MIASFGFRVLPPTVSLPPHQSAPGRRRASYFQRCHHGVCTAVQFIAGALHGFLVVLAMGATLDASPQHDRSTRKRPVAIDTSARSRRISAAIISAISASRNTSLRFLIAVNPMTRARVKVAFCGTPRLDRGGFVTQAPVLSGSRGFGRKMPKPTLADDEGWRSTTWA